MQLNSASQTLLKTALLSVLRQEYPSEMKDEILPDSYIDQPPEVQRSLLGDVLISSNTHWKEETLNMIDQIWEEEYFLERENGKIINIKDIPIASTTRNGTKISIYRGDITTLSGDAVAIVNAANDQGLGCFQPNHKCIDNVVHRRAGPRLRISCNELMKQRNGHALKSGTSPIVSDAYHLPATYIIHVTGPQVGRGIVSDKHRSDLMKTYMNSLDAAVNIGARSVVFPCISTGLFGFPSELAVDIALGSVQTWLEANPHQLDSVHCLNDFDC